MLDMVPNAIYSPHEWQNQSCSINNKMDNERPAVFRALLLSAIAVAVASTALSIFVAAAVPVTITT